MAEARSFEQDMLWSVLDQDAVSAILARAQERWGLSAEQALAFLTRSEMAGHLVTYRGTGPYTTVDLSQLSPEQAQAAHDVFVEATPGTLTRLRMLAG